MIALVLELNLLASSSWSRTQSALLTLVAADDDFCRTGQTSVMFHEKNTANTTASNIHPANLPNAKVLKQVSPLPFSP